MCVRVRWSALECVGVCYKIIVRYSADFSHTPRTSTYSYVLRDLQVNPYRKNW